jgi:hypothetical protein
LSVITFNLERTNGGATASADLTNDEATFNLRFVAIVDSVYDGEMTIYNDPRCPKLGSIYIFGNEVSPTATAQKFKFQQHGGRFNSDTSGTTGKWKWTVDVEYSTKKDEDKKPPGTEFAKVSFDTETYDEPLEFEITTKKPVLNSAEQKYDPPVMRERCRIIVRVDKSVAGFDASLAMFVSDAVNSSSFLGFPAHTLRITKISAHPQESNGFLYYALSVEMQYREIEFVGHHPHQAYVLDAGRYEWDVDSNTGERKKITDVDGDLVADSVPLDGTGLKLRPNEPRVFTEFQRYRKIDFNLLGIYP